jgi:hypothetical protein
VEKHPTKGRAVECIKATEGELRELRELSFEKYVSVAREAGLRVSTSWELSGKKVGIKFGEDGCAHPQTRQEGETIVCQDCGTVLF